MVPSSALRQFDAQAERADLASAAARRAWRQMRGRRWSTAWRDDVGPQVARIVRAAQASAAAQSGVYVGEVLRELDIDPSVATSLNPAAFAGVTGAGFPIEDAAYGSVVTTARSYASTGSEVEALERGANYLDATVATILADTARAAEVVGLAQRRSVRGYVRMIEPGACSRCAVLAGKFYKWNAGFDRHPLCRCVHIPAAENSFNDPRTNPSLYFDSLGKSEQDRIFTKAGAQAIRLGANPAQVVNARRGMRTAQMQPGGWIPKGRLVPTDVFGRPAYITTEGVTRHGVARKAMGSGRPVRLMPESILALAKDQDDARRLLRLYGYIT